MSLKEPEAPVTRYFSAQSGWIILAVSVVLLLGANRLLEPIVAWMFDGLSFKSMLLIGVGSYFVDRWLKLKAIQIKGQHLRKWL